MKISHPYPLIYKDKRNGAFMFKRMNEDMIDEEYVFDNKKYEDIIVPTYVLYTYTI